MLNGLSLYNTLLIHIIFENCGNAAYIEFKIYTGGSKFCVDAVALLCDCNPEQTKLFQVYMRHIGIKIIIFINVLLPWNNKLFLKLNTL